MASGVLRVEQPQPLAWLPSPRLPAGEAEAAESASRTGPGARARALTAATVGRGTQALRYLRLSRAWAAAIGRAVDHAPTPPGFERGAPIDVWQAEGLVALPVAVHLRRSRGGLAVYDARDLATQIGPLRAPAGSLARAAGAPRAGLGALDGRAAHRERPVRRRAGRGLGHGDHASPGTAPDHEPVERPAADLARAPRTRRPGRRSCCTWGSSSTAGASASCARPSVRCEGAALVVAGYGADLERFRARAAALPHAERIHFPGPVAPADIPAAIAAADVSAMPVEGDTLNHRLNTPTKLFDAMGAGVPVVASDLPGMAPIVRATGCGELCDPDDPADIARAIRAIIEATPERRAAYREAALRAARDIYAWEHQAPVLLDLYRDLAAGTVSR